MTLNFPKHKADLTLTHNEHKAYYQDIKLYLEERQGDFDITEEEKKKCIETDEIWELQWYPNTPVGFYTVAASTLEERLRLANEIKD